MAIYPPSKRAGVGGGGFRSRAPKNFLLFSFLSSFGSGLKSRPCRRTFGARPHTRPAVRCASGLAVTDFLAGLGDLHLGLALGGRAAGSH